MLNTICAKIFRINTNHFKVICKLSHTQNELVTQPTNESMELIDTSQLPDNDYVDLNFEKKSVLDECTEDVSHVAPYLKPTFNFAAYVNKSETLQELLKLGVNLHKLEQKIPVPQYILGLDFQSNIKNHVIFLHDLGLKINEIGTLITKNPFIFKQDLDHLQVRINYLESKKFTGDMILRILNRNPFWLMFSTQRIDRRLGYFQKEFCLTGDEVRFLTAKQPSLITYKIQHIKLNLFVLKEEMGFNQEETKSIILNKPKLFMKNQNKMLQTFEYIHTVMKIPLEMIVKVPEILTCRQFRVKERHLFLEKLGKAQYDPKQPNYVSVLALVAGTDGDFCLNVAKSSLQAFNAFLKSL